MNIALSAVAFMGSIFALIFAVYVNVVVTRDIRDLQAKRDREQQDATSR